MNLWVVLMCNHMTPPWAQEWVSEQMNVADNSPLPNVLVSIYQSKATQRSWYLWCNAMIWWLLWFILVDLMCDTTSVCLLKKWIKLVTRQNFKTLLCHGHAFWFTLMHCGKLTIPMTPSYLALTPFNPEMDICDLVKFKTHYSVML